MKKMKFEIPKIFKSLGHYRQKEMGNSGLRDKPYTKEDTIIVECRGEGKNDKIKKFIKDYRAGRIKVTPLYKNPLN